MSNTIAKSEFDLLPAKSQQTLLTAGFTVVDDPVEVAPAPLVGEESDDLFDQDESVVEEISDEPSISAETKYDIEGDAVYLNVTLEIAGQSFKLQGVKLTEKRNCMTKWDKDRKEFTHENADVMSVIDMVRKHGAELVNQHVKVASIHLGKAGEATVAKRDPLAELLAK